MKNIDKLITALYHAKSDSRENMLSDLILKVMYSANKQLNIQEIIDSIESSFHLIPIKYEVTQCLNMLVKTLQVIQDGTTYHLPESTQKEIHSSLVKGKDVLETRFGSFNKIVKDLFADNIQKEDVQKLWDVYNEYLMGCFMVFGRKAINIFLPFKDDELSQNDKILEQAKNNLQSDELYSAFVKLITEYPDRLGEAELQYLNDLASRAESFYSLGVEKEEYEKINNLQIKDLIVLADTNVLYTVLNLHVHQEKSAITEIVRLAKDKIIDLKIVYLPKTYRELLKGKRPLENIISRERFKPSQIKAMLASGNLDGLAKQYYENKLQNSEYPHPADNIAYASDILKQSGIMLYNHKFSEIEDDDKLFNKKIAEYMDYQHYYNNLYDQTHSELHLNKEDSKIAHDVFLREALTILRDKHSKDILKFICLTTDRSLIQFDQFMLRRENAELRGVINPNFMMPSLFIKKIRPFIPIITNDYRRAFISSLTVPTFHKESDDERDRTILTQKSLTYFKNLGIEDEQIICDIIKRELFLEEFSNHEKNKTAEEFIKSEIAKEIESIKLHKASLEREIEKQKAAAEKSLEFEKQETEKVKTEKEKAEKEKQSEIDKLVQKIKEKESLEVQLQSLNEEQAKSSKERTIELKRLLLDEVNQSVLTLENAESPLHDIIETSFNNYKWRLSIIPVAYFFIMLFLDYKLTWNVMEQYTFFTSLFGAICSYLYFAISGNSLSPIEHFKNKKNKIVIRVYTEFKFNVDYLVKQRQRKAELELELAELLKDNA